MLDKPAIVVTAPWWIGMVRAMHAGRARGIGALRDHARKDGPVSPIGDGNGKTALPTTYRKTGETCPSTCARLVDKTCFTLGGKVYLVQVRDTTERDNAVRAFIVAMSTDEMVRIHGSGDFHHGDKVDHEYVHMIADAAMERRRLTGKRWVAFGYTHDPKVTMSTPWLQLLHDSGVAIRISDRSGPGGSIVIGSWDDLPSDAFACVEQTHGKTCSECGACWNALFVKAVAFVPIGTSRVRLRKKLVTK